MGLSYAGGPFFYSFYECFSFFFFLKEWGGWGGIQRHTVHTLGYVEKFRITLIISLFYIVSVIYQLAVSLRRELKFYTC